VGLTFGSNDRRMRIAHSYSVS